MSMTVITDTTYQRTGRRTRTIAILLLAVAFVFSQSIAQQHVHSDGELTASCIACHHADSSPALLAKIAVKALYTVSASIPDIDIVFVQLAQPQHDYLSRAPPVTR